MDEKYEKNVYLSMLCEQCNQYDDMKFYLEDIIKNKKEDLNLDECNLISFAYKNIISYHRNALKTLQIYESKENIKENSIYLSYIIEYKKRIEKELVDICSTIISNIDHYLIPKAREIETRVFYNKLKADYFRYIAENVDKNDGKPFLEKSLKSYKDATEISKKLPITNQLRLGLALNFSIFYYEIMNDSKTACSITKETIEIASKAMGNTDEEDEEFKDAFRIIDTMNENLQMWSDVENKKD